MVRAHAAILHCGLLDDGGRHASTHHSEPFGGLAGGRRRGRSLRALPGHLFTPWARRLVELAGIAPGDRVLDVACGTGVVARQAAERVGDAGHVVGLDLNDDMLRVARAAAAPQGRASNGVMVMSANSPSRTRSSMP